MKLTLYFYLSNPLWRIELRQFDFMKSDTVPYFADVPALHYSIASSISCFVILG